MNILETVLTFATGGGATILGTGLFQWLRDRSTSEAKIEEHRDGLTFDLLRAAREEMSELRKEVTDLRGLTVKVAHIEEALDHIYALLHADGEIEMAAAARRASAFLRRMRPDVVETKGERRNAVQTEISARRLIDDAGKD